MNKLATIFAAACLLPASAASAQDIKVTRSGDTTIVKINNPKKYLILPVEENKDEAKYCSPPALLPTHGWTSDWPNRRPTIAYPSHWATARQLP